MALLTPRLLKDVRWRVSNGLTVREGCDRIMHFGPDWEGYFAIREHPSSLNTNEWGIISNGTDVTEMVKIHSIPAVNNPDNWR